MDIENEKCVCPICHNTELVFKVNEIYKESLTIFNKNQPHPFIETIYAHKHEIATLPNPESHDFTNIFAPPSGRMKYVQYLNPDLVVLILLGAMGYIMYMLSSQYPSAVIPFGGVVAVCLIFYFFIRRPTMEVFNQGKKESQEPAVSMEYSIEHWMKLYYCARDGIVFEKGYTNQVPLAEMKKYLMRRQ